MSKQPNSNPLYRRFRVCKVAQSAALCFSVFMMLSAHAGGNTQMPEPDEQTEQEDIFADDGEMTFDFDEPQAKASPSLLGELSANSRITLKHELSYKTAKPKGLVNNRSSAQFELSQHVFDHYFVRIDTKLNAYWANDHIGQSEGNELTFDNITREAFVQLSFDTIAMQLGFQNLIWGESDGGAVTDVVSPRNFREIFFIPLEEARIGQFMFKLDHFSEVGDWSLFYVPQPKFNQYAEFGTAYYLPIADDTSAIVHADNLSGDDEYGVRWRDRVGRGEIKVMAASVLNNDKSIMFDQQSGQFIALKQRNNMLGSAFNFVYADLLFRGEFAYKTDLRFNTSQMQLLQNDVIDSAIMVETSLPGNDTLSFELVNSHIRDWSADNISAPRNSQSLILSWNSFYFNDDLQINWLSIWAEPWASWVNSIRSNFKVDDHWTLSLDLHALSVKDNRSSLTPYKDQKQIAIRAQYQF